MKSDEAFNGEYLDARKPPPDYLRNVYKKAKKYEARDAQSNMSSWNEESLDRNVGAIFNDFIKAAPGGSAFENASGHARVLKSKVIPGRCISCSHGTSLI